MTKQTKSFWRVLLAVVAPLAVLGGLVGSVLAPASADTATSTALASSANPSVVAEPVTLTATVTGTPSPSGGTVTFKDGATSIGSAPLSSGTAAITVSNLTVGNHNLTAAYGGATGFSPSTSSVLAQRVNRDASTTTTTSSLNPSVKGDSVTFTATVAVVAPGAATPTGTVAFSDETLGRSLGTATLSSGTATFTTSTLASGSHRILAVYSGDASVLSSRGAVVQKVANPSITLTSPVGGESWALGSTHAITWTFTDSPGTAVKISLYKGTDKVATIAASAPIGSSGTGSFSWVIPSSLKAAANYRVDIAVVDKASISNRSATFTLS
jgi:Big-like domain-containing protein/Ser-Thr-rich glycosyl-phosphatidyl-inositol-anchored membrane family protein